MVSKICTSCLVDKADDDFSWRVKNKRRHAVCRSCHSAYRKSHYLANKEKYLSKANAWNTANRDLTISRKYGLSIEALEALSARHGGYCWICKHREGVVVDHDHQCCRGNNSCGDCVRGFLCRQCNSAIGLLNDDVTVLQSAIEYLRSTVN